MLSMMRVAYITHVSHYASAALLALLMMAGCTAAVRADINSFTLKQPLDNATVRETVPIRAPRNYLSQAGYATVYIDNAFRAAPAVPDSGDVIYLWDTKGTFVTPDQPNQQQSTADGPHTIVVHLFDKSSNEIAVATSTVRVANKITSLPDGVRLVYKWHTNENAIYDVESSLTTNGGQSAPKTLQSAKVKLDRSVDDVNGNEILLRDLVERSGYITAGATGTSASQDAMAGTSTTVGESYDPISKYWTVDKFGTLLVDNKPLGKGNHFGFPVPQFPARRVNVGDSWQTQMLTSLQWASNKPTFVRGTGRLDSFEWQDHYPTAKIVETYNGPARFFVDSSDASTPVDAGTVQLTRTIWFAYEAGIVVRVETSLTASTKMSSAQFAALGAAQGMQGTQPGSSNDAQMREQYRQHMRGGNPMLRQQGNPMADNGDNAPGSPVAPPNPFSQARTDQDQKINVDLAVTSTMLLNSVTG